MTAEKFIHAWIKSEILMPKRLVFKSTNLYELMLKEIQISKTNENKVKRSKIKDKNSNKEKIFKRPKTKKIEESDDKFENSKQNF